MLSAEPSTPANRECTHRQQSKPGRPAKNAICGLAGTRLHSRTRKSSVLRLARPLGETQLATERSTETKCPSGLLRTYFADQHPSARKTAKNDARNRQFVRHRSRAGRSAIGLLRKLSSKPEKPEYEQPCVAMNFETAVPTLH